MANDVILLVEDNPDDEMLTIRALKKCDTNCSVVIAHDGIEAIDYLFGNPIHPQKSLSELPKVVLLDLKLPKVDGIEVLKRIRSEERTRYLPVVILTSSTEERDLINCYECGANSYVRKPVDYARSCEFVRHLGQYWLLMNECPLEPTTQVHQEP